MIDFRKEVYKPGYMKQPDRKVNIFFPFHLFGGVQCGCECHTITNISEAVNYPVKKHQDTSECAFTDHGPNMVTTHPIHGENIICNLD